MDKIELTTKEMIELEARLTQINIESAALLAWLKVRKIEYNKIKQKETDKEMRKLFKRK